MHNGNTPPLSVCLCFCARTTNNGAAPSLCDYFVVHITTASAFMANFSLWLASQAGRCREVESLSPGNFDQAALQAALRVAAANDHAGVVAILLRAYAVFGSRHPAVCAADRVIQTALRCNSAAALRTLVEAKASVNRYNSFRGYNAGIAARYGALECLHVLVQAKAKLTSAFMYGITPIEEAAARGYVGIVHLLVQAKADIGANCHGVTPVLTAARNGNLHVVQLLIRAKVDAMRCSDDVNESPLFLAAARGHTAVVRCLLAHVPALAAVATRQDTYYPDGFNILAGSTPLDVARQFRHDDVVSLLLAAVNH